VESSGGLGREAQTMYFTRFTIMRRKIDKTLAVEVQTKSTLRRTMRRGVSPPALHSSDREKHTIINTSVVKIHTVYILVRLMNSFPFADPDPKKLNQYADSIENALTALEIFKESRPV
jgi:hypothetical protein